MKKILIISYCNECPYFDNEYYTYNEKCTKLNRVIHSEYNVTAGRSLVYYPIPWACPLDNYKEKE